MQLSVLSPSHSHAWRAFPSGRYDTGSNPLGECFIRLSSHLRFARDSIGVIKRRKRDGQMEMIGRNRVSTMELEQATEVHSAISNGRITKTASLYNQKSNV